MHEFRDDNPYQSPNTQLDVQPGVYLSVRNNLTLIYLALTGFASIPFFLRTTQIFAESDLLLKSLRTIAFVLLMMALIYGFFAWRKSNSTSYWPALIRSVVFALAAKILIATNYL